MSFGYSDFKKQLEEAFKGSIHYIKKDMLARTKSPNMRVNVMHITRKIEELDGN